jgi:hypothetical protein
MRSGILRKKWLSSHLAGQCRNFNIEGMQVLGEHDPCSAKMGEKNGCKKVIIQVPSDDEEGCIVAKERGLCLLAFGIEKNIRELERSLCRHSLGS